MSSRGFLLAQAIIIMHKCRGVVLSIGSESFQALIASPQASLREIALETSPWLPCLSPCKREDCAFHLCVSGLGRSAETEEGSQNTCSSPRLAPNLPHNLARGKRCATPRAAESSSRASLSSRAHTQALSLSLSSRCIPFDSCTPQRAHPRISLRSSPPGSCKPHSSSRLPSSCCSLEVSAVRKSLAGA